MDPTLHVLGQLSQSCVDPAHLISMKREGFFYIILSRMILKDLLSMKIDP